MARPRKPKVGTPERLRADLREFGAVHDFIAAHIERAGGARGTKGLAVAAAAKKFDIDPKTAERHYDRVQKSSTLGAVVALAWKDARIDEGMDLTHQAFSDAELHELQEVSGPFVFKLAQERLELIELRKQLEKRKRK